MSGEEMPRQYGAYGTTVLVSTDGGVCWDRAFDCGANGPVKAKQVAAALNAQAQWESPVPVPDAMPEAEK